MLTRLLISLAGALAMILSGAESAKACTGCSFSSESVQSQGNYIFCDNATLYVSSDKWTISGTWTTVGGLCRPLNYDSTFHDQGCVLTKVGSQSSAAQQMKFTDDSSSCTIWHNYKIRTTIVCQSLNNQIISQDSFDEALFHYKCKRCN